MIFLTAASIALALILMPTPALAWGPVTHIALGMQVLATVITPDHPLQATLQKLPEVFLYGSLAPDIVQGRRLQSRLRRHSHNWATGLGLLESARGDSEIAFAMGYLAHLAADVVAHNFFLPACLIGDFEARFAGHIYTEARFDSIQAPDYMNLLLKLLKLDFGPLDAMLDRAIDSPLVPFSAHRMVFDGGLRRIRRMGPRDQGAERAGSYRPHGRRAFSDTHTRRSPGCSTAPARRQRTNSIRWAKMRSSARPRRGAISSGWRE